jgi:hypothetical protein
LLIWFENALSLLNKLAHCEVPVFNSSLKTGEHGFVILFIENIKLHGKIMLSLNTVLRRMI